MNLDCLLRWSRARVCSRGVLVVDECSLGDGEYTSANLLNTEDSSRTYDVCGGLQKVGPYVTGTTSETCSHSWVTPRTTAIGM